LKTSNSRHVVVVCAPYTHYKRIDVSHRKMRPRGKTVIERPREPVDIPLQPTIDCSNFENGHRTLRRTRRITHQISVVWLPGERRQKPRGGRYGFASFHRVQSSRRLGQIVNVRKNSHGAWCSVPRLNRRIRPCWRNGWAEIRDQHERTPKHAWQVSR